MNTKFSDYLLVSVYKSIELTNFHDFSYEDFWEDLDMARNYYKDVHAPKHFKIIKKIYCVSMKFQPLVNHTKDYKFKHTVYNLLNKIMKNITIMG